MNIPRLLSLVLMMCGAAPLLAGSPGNGSRPSPDGRWTASWQGWGTLGEGSCHISFLRRADQKVFFTHDTNCRYVDALWNAQSTKCVLLDAPDNANSYLWLFRIHGKEVTHEELDYGAVSNLIEQAIPAARIENTTHLTRSGIEKMSWDSESVLRLRIIYNNIPVTVLIDLSKAGAPEMRIGRDK